SLAVTGVSGGTITDLAGNALSTTGLPQTFTGVIVDTTTIIRTDGTTSLAETGNHFFLNTVGSNTFGPELTDAGSAVYSGEFGGWTPIGAVKTASGYDIAWKMSGSSEYTIWSTDNSGNYLSNIVMPVAGNTTTLESYETIFQQDLNGDGVITIPTGQSMELTGAFSGEITFGGATGTLKIDHSANFSGTIGGQLAITDKIDLADITAGSNATVAYSGNNSPGTLTVSDGT